MINNDEYILIGKIIKPHGNCGLVKIFINKSFHIKNPDFFFINIDNELVPYFIERLSATNKYFITKLEDINSAEDALDLKGKDVYVLKKLIEEQISKNIIGFNVFDTIIGKIGTVIFINDSSKQTLIEVKYQNKNIFIPYNPKFIKNINIEEQIILVKIDKDLLEIN